MSERKATKTVSCGDLMPGCGYEAQAENEAALMTKVARHAYEVHGIKELTPELKKKVKEAIRDA